MDHAGGSEGFAEEVHRVVQAEAARPLRVFVSGSHDVELERKAIFEALGRFPGVEAIGYETMDSPNLIKTQRSAAAADLFLIVLGDSRGAGGAVGEYEAATQAGTRVVALRRTSGEGDASAGGKGVGAFWARLQETATCFAITDRTELDAAILATLTGKPWNLPPPSDDAEPVSEEAPKPWAGTALLWVDDKPENNTQLVQWFEEQGMRVDLALDTAEGLARLEGGDYTAIITDMGRPSGRRAGYELLREVVRRPDHPPVIIHSTSKSLNHHRRAVDHGALGSSANVDQIAEWVRQAIEQSRDTASLSTTPPGLVRLRTYKWDGTERVDTGVLVSPDRVLAAIRWDEVKGLIVSVEVPGEDRRGWSTQWKQSGSFKEIRLEGSFPTDRVSPGRAMVASSGTVMRWHWPGDTAAARAESASLEEGRRARVWKTDFRSRGQLDRVRAWLGRSCSCGRRGSSL
jgi:CheY-like chemotaxis protein